MFIFYFYFVLGAKKKLIGKHSRHEELGLKSLFGTVSTLRREKIEKTEPRSFFVFPIEFSGMFFFNALKKIKIKNKPAQSFKKIQFILLRSPSKF